MVTVSRRLLPILGMGLIGAAVEGAEPQLASLFPMGVPRSGSVTVTLGGTDLKETQTLLFSRPGISAKRRSDGRFEVVAAAEAPDRDGDVWAVTQQGISNPRRWTVSDLAEVVEREKNDTPETAQDLALGTIVNGSIDPATDRDHVRWDVDAGQRVTIAFRSESLGGSVRPALTVMTADGRELLHDSGGQAEPTLSFVAPVAGRYLVRIEDRAYRRDPFSAYRLEISTGPRLIAAFPSVLTRGERQVVAHYGYDLPGAMPAGAGFGPGLTRLEVAVDAPKAGDPDGGGWTLTSAVMLDGFRYTQPGVRGGVRFELVDEPVVLETDASHGRIDEAQVVEPGQVIAGRFLRAGEVDWYRFSARKGETLWLDAVGERAGLAMDLDMAILDPRGKLLQAFTDTAPPKGASPKCPLGTLDPSGPWTVPADGDYRLVIRDLYGPIAHGVERTYRLSVRRRVEDVRVVAVQAGSDAPHGFSIPRGGQAQLELIAVRRGGHDGPIRVRAEDLPQGLSAEETTIDAKKESATLSIRAAADAPDWTGLLALRAECECAGRPRSMPVLSASWVRDARARLARLDDGVAATLVGPRVLKKAEDAP